MTGILLHGCIGYHFSVSGMQCETMMTQLTPRNKRLVSREMVVPCLCGSEILKFGIKQVNKGQISTVVRKMVFQALTIH